MIEIGGLWLSKCAGKAHLTGRLGNARIVILKNKFKTSGRHPDYRLYLAEVERGGDQLTADEQRELAQQLAAKNT